MGSNTFAKEEKLKSRKEIERLFSGTGQSVAQYPLRVIWQEADQRRGPYPVQAAVSVSKKKFKKAVDRNRVKRLVREAWRLHKHHIYENRTEEQPQLVCMFLFIGKELPSYSLTEKAMKKILRKMKERC